jgi:hypothetical protein
LSFLKRLDIRARCERLLACTCNHCRANFASARQHREGFGELLPHLNGNRIPARRMIEKDPGNSRRLVHCYFRVIGH